MDSFSVAIAGCGPAGLAAALYLSRAGHRVTLYERFVVPKALGSGLVLQPTGQAVLADLGLGTAMAARGAPLARMIGRATPSGRLVLDIGYDALGTGTRGLAVHRAALFDVLFSAVEAAGIPVVTGFEVVDLRRAGARTSLMAADGRTTVLHDLVVDALGSRSPLPARVFGRAVHRPLAYGALWANLPWPEGGPFASDVLEQRYRAASTMIGVLPIGRRSPESGREAAFFWSFKPADYPHWRAEGIGPWKDRVLRLWPETEALLGGLVDSDQLVLARYGHHTLACPVAPGIAFIGDCAHAASPQLGQGANNALLDALALSAALAAADTLDNGLGRYAATRRWHVRFYQAMSWLFTPVYQSDSRVLPMLRDRLVAPLTRVPGVPRLLAGLVAGTSVRPVRGLEAGLVRNGGKRVAPH